MAPWEDRGARPAAHMGMGCSAQPRAHSCRQKTCPCLQDCINRVTATHHSNNIYPQAAKCFSTEQIFVRYTPTVPLTANRLIGRWINRELHGSGCSSTAGTLAKTHGSSSTGVTRGAMPGDTSGYPPGGILRLPLAATGLVLTKRMLLGFPHVEP